MGRPEELYDAGNYARLVHEGSQLIDDDPERAREALAGALAVRHAHAPLWKLYAEACLRAGDVQAAYGAMRRAAFIDPGNAPLLARLGKVAAQLGNKEEALEWLRQALAATNRNLSDKLRDWLGSLGASLPRRRSGGAKLPRNVRRLVAEADRAQARRWFKQALACLDLALEEMPDEPELLLRKAQAQLALGKPRDADKNLRRARDFGGSDPELNLALIEALARQNLAAKAAELFDDLPEEVRRSADARKTEAEYLMSSGEAEHAETILKELAEEIPADPEVKVKMAWTLIVRGAFGEAKEWLRQASRASPQIGWIYLRAAMTGAMRPGSELFSAAEALAGDAAASQRDRAVAHFALGRVQLREGNNEAAFHYLEKGNALVDETYGAAQGDDFADRIIRASGESIYTGDANRRGEGRIFIVSVPRSGSTLIERILSAHPQICSVGESGSIADIVRQLSESGDYPECVTTLSEERLERMAAAYLRDATTGCEEVPWVVDKNLGNFLHLGLIARMLPGAQVVHVRRDPMDIGFSLFCQVFENGHGYAYTQENIGHFLRLHDRLMVHWKKALPIRMHEVSYEALVDDQEGETRRLLDALGLPFDKACLEFHKSAGDVRTASVVQVREKIYRRSMGHWQEFADMLVPLSEALSTEPRSAGG